MPGKSKSVSSLRELTPREVVLELDKYIIGQHAAKRSVAIAVRNRWRRLQTVGTMREEIMPNNIILIGPTGVGKTEIARRLAKLVNAPFIKVEASKFTEVGYVGRDVESMIRDLTEYGVNMVKAEKAVEVRGKAEALAEERILEILVPPIRKHRQPVAGVSSGSESLSLDAEEENGETRAKFREKLRAGELDSRLIDLEVTSSQMPSMQVLGPMNMDDMGINIQDMLGNLLPKKTKKRKVSVREARQILIQEESQKLIDVDAAVKDAITRIENSGIVFIDEIDKITGGSHGGGPDVSREGVQRDLLPIVEGSNISTKYGVVRTDHILFVASGAFHVSKPSDLIPELQGRFPIRVELNSLTEEDFVKILTIPENALIKQYMALMATEGVHLDFTDDAIHTVAKIATQVNEEVENIGARRLHTIMTTLLDEILFESPERYAGETLKISKELVEEKLSNIAKDRDLSRYIL